jgi:hypothetical protein
MVRAIIMGNRGSKSRAVATVMTTADAVRVMMIITTRAALAAIMTIVAALVLTIMAIAVMIAITSPGMATTSVAVTQYHTNIVATIIA